MDPVTVGVTTLVVGGSIAMIMAWKRRQYEAAQRGFVTLPAGQGKVTTGGTGTVPPAAGNYVLDNGNFQRGYISDRVTASGQVVPHRGVDIGAAEGVPVHAVASGTVREAGPKGGYGNAIVVVHSTGQMSLYGHLSRMLVSGGQAVTRGEVIGEVGRSSAGPDGIVPSWGATMPSHLHLEIHSSYPPHLPVGGPTSNTVLDPVAWLRQQTPPIEYAAQRRV